MSNRSNSHTRLPRVEVWQLEEESFDHLILKVRKAQVRSIYISKLLHDSDDLYIQLLGVDGTPLQYSCLENPMDRGAW